MDKFVNCSQCGMKILFKFGKRCKFCGASILPENNFREKPAVNYYRKPEMEYRAEKPVFNYLQDISSKEWWALASWAKETGNFGPAESQFLDEIAKTLGLSSVWNLLITEALSVALISP